jgi:hypothetical protein
MRASAPSLPRPRHPVDTTAPCALGFTAPLSPGVGFEAGPVDLRAAARLGVDVVQVDGARQASLAPGGELSVLF